MIVNNLKLNLEGKDIFENVSFTINKNDKIGLVGPNGSGKSSLLKVLANQIENYEGQVNYNGETIGYLKQEINYLDYNLSIEEYIKRETGYLQLFKKLKELEENLNDNNMEEYSECLNEFLVIDGYSFEDNMLKILEGLKVHENITSKIGILSGGEKIKILLTIILLKNNDTLLLDEPTNNLDIQAIEWLENYLKQLKKQMIIVSHDETFLQNVCTKIFELNKQKLSIYNMPYNSYVAEKKLEYQQKYNEYLKKVKERETLKKQLSKAKEWSQKGSTSKAHNDNDKLANNYAKERTNSTNVSMLSKKLSNLDVPQFTAEQPINFFFDFGDTKGNKDIHLENLVCGYDNFKTPIINLDIEFGTKLLINGSNGSGKTTLIKTILNEIQPLSGNIKIGSSVKIGYISQDTLNRNTSETIYLYLTKDKINIDNTYLFTLLNKFNISFTEKDKLYSSLSPGERTRVNLVKLALDKINVLILDEVTNHLDKEALDLIYELLNNYSGTIISISHNRKYNEILNPNCTLDIETGLVRKIGLNK